MNTPPDPAARPVVLLVDNDKAVLHRLAQLLQPGFTVRVATTAERALRAVASAPQPDAILLGLDDPALAALPAERILRIDTPLHAAALLAELRRRLPGRSAAPDAALAGRRALVVDDDALFREIVVAILNDAGIGAVVASDGAAGLAALELERFDWILMDMQMPVLDGLAATRRIRADARLADACVIAVTGSDGTAERQACQAAGMNDFLVKPVDPEVLLARLAHWLDRPAAAPLEEQVGAGGTAAAAGIDLARLDALGRGDPARIEKYARHFVASATEGLDRIAQALASDDLPAARREAHKIKSAARWVGALALGDSCEALETPDSDDIARARRIAAECATLYTGFAVALAGHLPGLDFSNSPRSPS